MNLCDMVDLFINRLFTSDSIPTFLWTDRRLFMDIEAIFRDCDNSIVSVGRMLKSTLRRYFAVPGKSIRDATCNTSIDDLVHSLLSI